MYGVADDCVVRRGIEIKTMVAVPVGDISDDKIATRTCVDIHPGVFIAIGNIMQDRIVVARVESNSACIPLPLLGIGESKVVADQVIVGTICQ